MINNDKLKSTTEVNVGGNALIFSEHKPVARRYENDSRIIFVLGTPILGERIDCETLKNKLFNENIEKIAGNINGSFLFFVYCKRERKLVVANDRYASISAYYRVDSGRLTIAVNYSDIWLRFHGRPGFTINREAFYEFIHMKRLFGDKTYDTKTKFLNSASILTFISNDREPDVKKYWVPNCGIDELDHGEAAVRLAFLIKQSFKRLTSDTKRFGLLLSGGLDSRSVLAASDKPLVCITTCEYKNNEYLVARDLSLVKNYEHIFITKPPQYYHDIIEKAVYEGAGMSVYASAHFFNIEEAVKKRADVLLHGYGFDFLFRGKYLPCAAPACPLIKKITYRRKLASIGIDSKDIAEDFIEKISYRLEGARGISSPQLLNYKHRKIMTDMLYHEIKKIFDEAKNLSANPYKQWDYCCFHNVSRHYTWLNILSIRPFIEERTVAFDNDLYNFFWSANPELFINGDIFKKAIRILSPGVFKIRNANTNLSLDDPPFLESSKIILNKILQITRLNKAFKWSIPFPAQRERSWPIDASLIREKKAIREAALSLCASGELESLSFLNMDRIRACVHDHVEGRADYTNLVFTLLTVKAFLR